MDSGCVTGGVMVVVVVRSIRGGSGGEGSVSGGGEAETVVYLTLTI